MYKIIFIDELSEESDILMDYFETNSKEKEFEIITLLPTPKLDDLIDEIFALHPDAIITDFMLNEYKEDIDYNVPYNGVDVLNSILEHKENFPCFVMTSYDDDAIKNINDVNQVYIKDILHGAEQKTNSKFKFTDKINHQIKNYQLKIKKAEEELSVLLEKTELNVYDQEKLENLDDFLEKATGSKNKISKKLKSQNSLNDLHKMIEQTDILIKKVKDEKDT